MANKPEEANPILQVKLKQLRIACGRTGSVLESNKNTAICRQIESLKALSADVEKSRMKAESYINKAYIFGDFVSGFLYQVGDFS